MKLKIKISYLLFSILLISSANTFAAAKIQSASERSETFDIEAAKKAWDLGLKLFNFAKLGNVKMVKELINKGANVNALKVVQSGLTGEINGGPTALSFAKLMDNDEMINLLTKAGAKEESDGLDDPYLNLSDLSRALEAESGSESPNIESVNKLIKRIGENINKVGVKALVKAINNNNNHIVKLLLDAGVDPNSTYSGDQSVLSTAVNLNNKEAVKQLLEAGADLNKATLDRPISNGPEEMIELLLTAGVDISNLDYLENEIKESLALYNKFKIMQMLKDAPSRREEVIKKWEEYLAKKITELEPKLFFPLTRIISEYTGSYNDIPLWFKLENYKK